MITLKTLPQATAQEVFDQVATHLLAQNAKSVQNDAYMMCMYRGEDNLKCAAGCLIADEEYLPVFDEVGPWLALVEQQLVPENHAELIVDLQNTHDSCEPHEWHGKLSIIANKHGLNTDAI